MAPVGVPPLPAPLSGLVKHIGQHPETPMTELLEPYRKYEANLRQAFARDPDSELLKDPHVNVLPLFTEDTHNIKIRARKLGAESKEEKAKYIMPLPAETRRPDGSPAVVQNLKEFQRNFNVFSESSLAELDWSNVVAAGSSVVNTLLPVPDEYNRSKRGLREFYHEKFSPASDVDLFLYGLTEEQAIEKIRDIEAKVRDALLAEITVVRTKHAITICSQYPVRHIQIVLRIYKSVSEILTGFDIDCSGAAYDGKQVYCTPRALQSYMTQINHIDLSRRSPSYENRLSKYSHRGFEVYWREFDRSRIDPTIFERSFYRTVGLARLLVLERLPTESARNAYVDKRRAERGRPHINRYHRQLRALAGNIKEEYEDEVADWFTEDEVSNYHTFTLPYGQRFNAKRIEKLCYTRDLLLNAEWNENNDLEVYLHRHPAFFGRFDDVVNDCCGYCPVPKTQEELEVAAENEKVFVSGRISFMKDDPGRQEIGSFNPLNDDDWTEMAYVGNTARLCQAIVDEDLEHVVDWLAQEGADPNTRDHTGRTPLHLAVMSSTPQIVRALVDAGARLVARLADGRTALHLAAIRGNVEIVEILLNKSAANEAEYEEKVRPLQAGDASETEEAGPGTKDAGQSAESDGELVDVNESDDGVQSMATGSFVEVAKENAPQDEFDLEEGFEDEPDFYDINVASWDMPCSALHFAIMEGHVDVVRTLVQEYGADVLLPIKLLENRHPQAAVLTLALALALPVEKAVEMARALLGLGASAAQADMSGTTALHSYVEANAESLLDTLWEVDPAGTQSAINHIVFADHAGRCETPLGLAVKQGNLALVSKLLRKGANPNIEFEAWLKSAKLNVDMENRLSTFENNQDMYYRMVQQPLIVALQSSKPEAALELLEHGADPNVVTKETRSRMRNTWNWRFPAESALDLAESHLKTLRQFGSGEETSSRPTLPEGMDAYLAGFAEGTYEHMVVSQHVDSLREKFHRDLERFERVEAELKSAPGAKEKEAAIAQAVITMEKVREALLAKGAKPFAELHPDFKDRLGRQRGQGHTPAKGQTEKPFHYPFTFANVKDVTKTRHQAYLKLFNAAFQGDLETIKTLTLASWDAEKAEAPLKIAAYDQTHRHNPFSLAFSRGHYDVAKAVLEIAQAQYAPEERPRTRFMMEPADNDSDYSDDDSVRDSADGDGPPRVYRHIVDAHFTIENVGQVSMKVNSRTKPLEMVGWTNPFSAVINNNDMQGLKFLLEVCEYWTAQKSELDDESPGFYSFSDLDFISAVNLGRVEMLGEIIKRTGAGLPLENLVKETGVELQVKPRYYQGLTVYGKKRKDWAAAGRIAANGPSGFETSPLLLSAFAGRIESLEWFLSDTPLRQYLAFAKSKAARNDVRLKHLAQSPGGFDGAIRKWLDDQNDLLLHAAIVASPSARATELVSYLVTSQPSLLEVKSANGATPLLLAYRLGRLDAAKILVDAGADQTTKDQGRNNLLHAALHATPSAEKLKPMLDLLDRDALVPMMKERNKLDEGGQTPLHQYLCAVLHMRMKSPKVPVRMIKMLVAISPEVAKQALRMIDGAGDTPLHTLLVRNVDPRVVRAVVSVDQSLLFCENAVGRTPAEVAHDRFLADVVKISPSHYQHSDASVSLLVTRPPQSFVERKSHAKPREHEPDTVAVKVWRMCSEVLARNGQSKRTLVSLNSANLVAKRLGEQRVSARYRLRVVQRDDDETSVSTESQDTDGEGAAPEPKPAGSAVKTKRRRTDAITNKDKYNRTAWARPKREGGDADGADEESLASDEDDDEDDDEFLL